MEGVTDPASSREPLVVVPELVGLGWREARALADQVGLFPAGPDPDGPPLAELGWPGGVVIGQLPQAGVQVPRGSRVVLEIVKPPRGPDLADDREPRHPLPPPLTLAAEAVTDRHPDGDLPGA